MLRMLALLYFALVVGTAHADDGEATEPTAYEAFDAAFGKYLVGPMASVMFWDIVFWDDELPPGVVPTDADGNPIMVDGADVLEAKEDGSYRVGDRIVGPVADAVPVLTEPQTRVQGSVPVSYTTDAGALVGTVKGGPLPLGDCAAAAACGVPLIGYPSLERKGGVVRIEAGGGHVAATLAPGQEEAVRVLTDRAPFPVLAAVDEAGELQLLPASVPVPAGLFPVEVGATVQLGDTTGEVLEMTEAAVTVRGATRTVQGPLPNPDGLSIPLVVAWLVLGAVYFTLRMGFINLRGFGHAIAVTAGRYDNPEDEGEISHFKALSSALSATVGLGNIAGVAIAVAVGGPGAIPWMILAGFLGMSSKFTECTLGQMYRTTDARGNISGGPFRYLHKGLEAKGMGGLGRVLSIVFAVMCIGGSLGGGNMFQANQSYQIVLETARRLSPDMPDFAPAYGVILAVLVGAVILGGIKRIGAAAGLIVPVMCGVYVVAALYIIGVNVDRIPEAFEVMMTGAFSTEAGLGGLMGALIQGFRRAAFSNEAGVGSASIAHSAAATDEPVREGIVALLEPFIDTIVVCTMTGLVVVITGAYLEDTGDGVLMTSAAFGSALSWFPYVLTFAVVMFAFSTMISWSYYGERCATFLFGPSASVPYKIVFLLCAFAGSVFKLGNVLDFSDLMILGMAFPNILGAILLSGSVKQKLDDYWGRLKSGEMKPVN